MPMIFRILYVPFQLSRAGGKPKEQEWKAVGWELVHGILEDSTNEAEKDEGLHEKMNTMFKIVVYEERTHALKTTASNLPFYKILALGLFQNLSTAFHIPLGNGFKHHLLETLIVAVFFHSWLLCGQCGGDIDIVV